MNSITNSNLLTQPMLEKFMNKIKQTFPTMVAGVIADKHGFPIHSKIENKQLDEELLAVSAVAQKPIVDLTGYQKVIRPLGMNSKLLVILKKSHQNLHRFKTFNKILEEESPL